MPDSIEPSASYAPSRGNQEKARFSLEGYFKSIATNISKLVFQWLYSFSLFIFMVLTFAFIVVTPVDITIKTWGTPSTGVKVFIILGACVLFFLISMLVYLSRLYKSRVAVNQIPSKSVYIPLEKNDLPSDVLNYIERRLRECVCDVKERAGSLHNKNELFNYPGMAPPEYIQKRNVKLGYQDYSVHLPPNCRYDDVILSLGLKLKVDGLLVGSYRVPYNYTFREILVAMTEYLQKENQLEPEMLASIHLVITLYEKFRFSGCLIEQHDLLSFLVELEKVVYHYIKHRSSQEVDPFRQLATYGTSRGSNLFAETYSSQTASDLLTPSEYSRSRTSLYSSNVERYAPQNWLTISRAGTRTSRGSTGISRTSTRDSRFTRHSSTASVVKNRLSFASSRRYLVPASAQSGYLTDSDSHSQRS